MDIEKIYDLEREVDATLFLQQDEFNRRFSQAKVKEAIELAFEWRLKQCDLQKESLFSEFKLAAAKGTPFAEREKLIDKKRLAMLERGRKWLVESRKKYTLVPVEFWMIHGMSEHMHKVGLRRFAQIHLSTMIDTPVEYPEPLSTSPQIEPEESGRIHT